MKNSYLIKGSEKLLEEVRSYINDNDVTSMIDFSRLERDNLSLNAPTPQDAIVLWELIMVCANLGGAISFLDYIKQFLTNNTQGDMSSVTVTSRCGSYIKITSSTKDIEIQEFAEKTIIKIQ